MSLRNFKLGEVRFGLTTATVIGQRKEVGLDYDGLISPPALGISRISFDLTEGVLSFSSQSLLQKPQSEVIAFRPKQPQG